MDVSYDIFLSFFLHVFFVIMNLCCKDDTIHSYMYYVAHVSFPFRNRERQQTMDGTD